MIGLSGDPFQTSSLGLYGEWAQNECGVICSFLNPGDVALDVGANIGSITVAMAKKVGISGHVWAFEPQSAPFYCLCGNIALTHALTHTKAINAAVSDFDGTIQVPIVDVNKQFNFGGVRLQDEGYDKALPMPKEDVPCVKIDSLALPRVDFIKIDVETMEAKVLAGAADTIRRCRPVILAEALQGKEDGIEALNVAAMIAFFKANDYDARLMMTHLYAPDNVRYCPDNVFPGGDRNILAIPNEREKPLDFLELDVA